MSYTVQKRLAIKRKLMRLAIYGATSNAKEQDESEDDADSDAKLFNPFETPLLLVEILIVAPVPLRWRDTLCPLCHASPYLASSTVWGCFAPVATCVVKLPLSLHSTPLQAGQGP